MNKVAVYGGLGNQMFQYAFCQALNKNGKRAEISFLCYIYYKHHCGFDLNRAFKLELRWHKVWLAFFMENCGIIYNNRLGRAVFRRLINVYEKTYKIYREKKEFEFDENVYNQNNVLFYGVWQSEKYLKNIKDSIIQQFAFRVPADEKNKKTLLEINNTNSVSIHIRRGDFAPDKLKNFLDNSQYYTKAVNYIKDKIKDPFFFVFSDDIEWVKTNLELNNCTYINYNSGKKSYIDMYLMSCCKHNIIANSTFSWWGAWLNTNNNKIVVMPGNWMVGRDCKELYIENWVVIEV